MNYQDKVNKLINKTCHKVEDKTEEVIFHLDNDEKVIFSAYGECCSDSWIEHCETMTSPEKILSFEEISIDSYDEYHTKKRIDETMDDLKFYFYEVKTEKGSYKIEMRNNSNGYYGGWLE